MKLRDLIVGQVLLREGDPPGAIYVVCAGKLRVFRKDYATDVEGYVDVAWLKTGDVIGELGSLLARPRSATVQALEPSRVLEIMPEELPRLARQHQPLVRVITAALRERAGVPASQLAKLASTLGLDMPAGFSREFESQRVVTGHPTVPTHDPSIVYPKVVDCPACNMQFAALTLRAGKDSPVKRESDFHNVYETAHNPYDYEVWVCPNDLYAALPVDFPQLSERHKPSIAATVERVIAGWTDDRPDFNVDRTFVLRQRALELTLAQYELRRMPPTRLAAIEHRLAWCARERADAVAEAGWLTRALQHYTTAYESTNLGGAKEELRIQYLCGELTLRLGDAAGAAHWFSNALRHSALRDHNSWESLLREQLGVARAQSAPQEPAA
jgi:uncharacterized protein